jgi:glycosyltransferase involved in cell wall biosynthesis
VVEALTSQGWLFDGARPVPFVVRRYGVIPRLLYRIGEAFGESRRLQRVGVALRTTAAVRAARATRPATGDQVADVFVVSLGLDPLVASTRAGNGRWLFYQFSGPFNLTRSFAKSAERAEQRRRATGGRARVVAPSVDDRVRWQQVAPFLDPIMLPIAGSRDAPTVPDAKLRLGLSVEDKVALVFGEPHDGKDVDLVARTFAELPDWQVVVAGRVVDEYRSRTGARDPILLGGFVDEATRALVFSAADVVVLSFRAEFQRSSGVLADAVSWGVPVVCSDGSPPADVVKEYRLGNVFAPGDPDSLSRAVRRAPARVQPADLARARAELSNRVVAARFLAAL